MPQLGFASFVVQPVQLTSGTCLLPSCSHQAFSFGKGNDIALEYLKELRQNGTDRRTEMSTLISGGFLEYQAIKEAEEAEARRVESRERDARSDSCLCATVFYYLLSTLMFFSPYLVLRLQKNKPPPSEEELQAQEKLFQEQREEEYAAIRAQNAIKRKEDDIKLVEVSTPYSWRRLLYS